MALEHFFSPVLTPWQVKGGEKWTREEAHGERDEKDTWEGHGRERHTVERDTDKQGAHGRETHTKGEGHGGGTHRGGLGRERYRGYEIVGHTGIQGRKANRRAKGEAQF